MKVILAAAVFTDANGRTLLFPPPRTANDKTSADHVPTLVSRMSHFPTVSVTEEPASELRRFLQKLVAGTRSVKLQLAPVGKIRHVVTYRDITVVPFRIDVKKLPRIKGSQQVPLNDISVLPVSNLTRKVARAALAAVVSVPNKL